MSRRSSSSSPRRSSGSEDHTSNTSSTSIDATSKGEGKGKERAREYDHEHDHTGLVRVGSGSGSGSHASHENRGRRSRYPLSGPIHHDLPTTSYSTTSYSLSDFEPEVIKPPRRLSLGVNARRTRILQIVLALSIPILGLLLANEIRINNHRSRLHENAPPERRTTEWEAMDFDVRPQTLAEMRKGYEKKRRKELEANLGNGWVIPFWPTPDRDYDEQGFLEDVQGWWPEWWGSRDEVGPSPYDHVPAVAARGEKKRLLFLTSESPLYLSPLHYTRLTDVQAMTIT